MRNQRHDDDDDQRILKDAEQLHVPMVAMDALQRDVKAHFERLELEDAVHGDFRGNRPGFRFVDNAAAKVAREHAYRAYDHQLTNAWRGDASSEFIGQLDPRRTNSMPDTREAAYRARDAADADAWRGPRDSGKWPIGN